MKTRSLSVVRGALGSVMVECNRAMPLRVLQQWPRVAVDEKPGVLACLEQDPEGCPPQPLLDHAGREILEALSQPCDETQQLTFGGQDMTVIRDAQGNPTCLEFLCRSSKTDPFRRSVIVKVAPASADSPMCPVRAVDRYLRQSHHHAPDQPLFRLSHGSFITRNRINIMIKRLARRAGFDTSRVVWPTHSMRAGGATSLSFLGVLAHQIQLLGRWQSDCYLRYLVISADAPHLQHEVLRPAPGHPVRSGPVQGASSNSGRSVRVRQGVYGAVLLARPNPPTVGRPAAK